MGGAISGFYNLVQNTYFFLASGPLVPDVIYPEQRPDKRDAQGDSADGKLRWENADYL